jgi:ABC-type branched-subunit amino acid transport system substrate-binding protein
LTVALAMIVFGIFDLLYNGVISSKYAEGLIILTIFLLVPSLIHLHLSPLGHFVRLSEQGIAEDLHLAVKVDSRDEVGRMATVVRALRVMAGDESDSEVRVPSVWASGRALTAYASATCVVVVCVLFAKFTDGQPIAVGPAHGATPSSAVPGVTSAARASSTPTLAAPALPTPSVRGVTDDAVVLGMSAPFSGQVRGLSGAMKLGLDTAFAEANAHGGVGGRQVKLVALDNGYDEKRALDTTRELVEARHVFALVGSVGTPTTKAVLPYVSENKILLFGPLTGSPILRKDPPDRYVFNVRSSYDRETSQMVSYLLDVKHVPARAIVVFAQNDSYGDAGYDGAVRTLRKKVHGGELLRVGYERNTVDVSDAVSRVMAYSAANQKSGGVRAVIVVATAGASAAFTGKIASLGAAVLNVSFVDSAQLATEFKEHWPGVGAGVIVTQVVPHYESGATGVRKYREALREFFPNESPGFASLEGYVVGRIFLDGLARVGRDLDTEKLIDALEKIQGLDLGTGASFGFGVSNHQASDKVWATEMDASGSFKPLDAEWME